MNLRLGENVPNKQSVHLDVRKFPLANCQRVVDIWNKLSQRAIDCLI